MRQKKAQPATDAPNKDAAELLAWFKQMGYSLEWHPAKGGMKRNVFLRSDSSRYSFTYEPETDEWRLWDRTGINPTRVVSTRDFVSNLTPQTEATIIQEAVNA